MLAVFHDKDFVDDQILLGLLLKVHLLDGYAFVGTIFIRHENTTRSALADLAEVTISLPRIGICADSIELGHNIRSLALPRPLTWPGRWANTSLLRW